jgi:hypothetical protein
MKGELYINDFKVDLDERVPFPLTFNMSDIKDVSARKGNKSKTITLPSTKDNYKLMRSVFSLTETEGDVITDMSFDTTIKAQARYYYNGLLEFNGIAQLMECKLNEGVWTFDITLVSDTIDYISKLSKIKINELDWSEYNHTLTLTNQQNSWSGIIQQNGSPATIYSSPNWTGTGYYYGMIDYGFDRSSPTCFGVEHLPPQLFCYEILKKSFDYAGITWSSNFLESQRFKKLLMAYAGGDLPTITTAQSNQDSSKTAEVNNTGGKIIDVTSQDYGFSGIAFLPNVSMGDEYDSTIVQDLSSQIQTASPLKFIAGSDGLFKINYKGDHDIDFTFTAPNVTSGYLTYGNYELRILVYKNNNEIVNDQVYNGSINGLSANTSISFTFDYNRIINLAITDEVTVKLQYNLTDVNVGGAGLDGLTKVQTQIESSGVTLDILRETQTLFAGATLNIGSFLPDMDCATFFKGIITAFNLYVKPKVDNNTIMEIEPLSDFYNASGDAIDWTYKLDKSKEIKVTPTINMSAKNYVFKFTDDKDYWNERYTEDIDKQYGEFIVDSQNQYAVKDNVMKLPFSQKILVRIPLNSTTYTDLIVPRNFQIKFKEDGNSEIVKKKGKPFLVQLGKLHTGAWNHRSETGAMTLRSSYPYVGHLDDLDSPSFDFNFGLPDYVFWQTSAYTTNNLYAYHEKFIKEIISRYGKLISCYLRLTSEDINKLDLKNLINIDGVVYRLQKVSDYDSGKGVSTMVELIRIIQGEGIQTTIVNPPYNPYDDVNARNTEDDLFRVTEDGTLRLIDN